VGPSKVNFMRKTSTYNFMFPDIKEEDVVAEDNIICKLAKLAGGTERALNHMTFYFDFAKYNVK